MPLIRGGQAHRVVEGGADILRLAKRVRQEGSRYVGFPFNIECDDGIQSSLFEPSDELTETDEVAFVNGQEYGSGLPMKLIIFKLEPMKSEVGTLLMT